ncbi:MAG: hypothetical protein KatS3mg004_3355 [Bryobacteraceae bacterium]|nr:MAG: hypothetical protein KatS3mg004_3355 [Bryobacteraceae bacterium]
MCNRQNPPVFGGDSIYLRQGEHQLAVTYRRAVSDRHYQGKRPFPELDPFGPINTQNLVNMDWSYGVSRRWTLGVNVPIVFNSFEVYRAPAGSSQREWVGVRARGIGDVTFRTSVWLLPVRESAHGNLGLGFGLKVPTGDSGVKGRVFGREIPADISVQPGDGAWAPVLTLFGFHQFEAMTVYGSAAYMANPRNTTGVPGFFQTLGNPNNRFPNSSTDQFLYHFGASFRTARGWPTPMLAYRISGVPVHDAFGPSDGFRRPGTIGMVEPGVGFRIRSHALTLTVPLLAYVNIKDSPTTARTEDATVPGVAFVLTWTRRVR